MNDSEIKPSSPATGTESADIQLQLTILLVGLIVLAAVFSGYLWSTVRQRKADFENMQNAATPMVQAYNREKGTVDTFISRVIEYSKTHPDFEPIMRKYQPQIMPNDTAKPASTSAPAPAPAPAAAPKK
jgi:hypothetical protein